MSGTVPPLPLFAFMAFTGIALTFGLTVWVETFQRR
jgi:hypothetical protein